MKKLFIYTITTFLLTNCNSLKRLKNVTQGNVFENNFIQEIPFDYYEDLIFIKVFINNNNYNFLFDTGWDLTAVGNHILEDINISKVNVSGISTDAANKNIKFDYLTLENINIGTINFINIGVFSHDFTHLSERLGCLGSFDGVIGNNLIRKAKWQIDYKNKVIRISDKIEQFSIDEKSFIIPIKTKSYGHAYIDIELNGNKEKFSFDTGFSGKFQSDLKLFEKLKSDKNIEYTVKNGFSGIQANGGTSGQTFVSIIEDFKMSNIRLNNQRFDFEKGESSLIGNEFFEDFIVTIDWEEKHIFLEKQTEFTMDTLSAYELLFAPNYLKNQFQFYNTWLDYQLDEPTNLTSKILSINSIDVSDLSTIELCDLWNINNSKLLTKNVEIEILDNGNKKKIILTKKQLLPKEKLKLK